MSYRGKLQFASGEDDEEGEESARLLGKPADAAYHDDASSHEGYHRGNASVWAVSLYSLPNLIIAGSYFNIGIAINFLPTPISYYLVTTLDADTAVVNTLTALLYLPWCLKIFFGVLSDTTPIAGRKRGPYLVGGWIGFIGCNLVLCAQGTPSIANVLVWSFAMAMFAQLADTVST